MAEVRIARGEAYQEADGEFRWRTLGGNGEKLGGGEGYTRLENAEATLVAHLHDGTEVRILNADGAVVRSYRVGEDVQHVAGTDHIQVGESGA